MLDFDPFTIPVFVNSGLHPNHCPVVPFSSEDLSSKCKSLTKAFKEAYGRWDVSGCNDGLAFSNFTTPLFYNTHSFYQSHLLLPFFEDLLPQNLLLVSILTTDPSKLPPKRGEEFKKNLLQNFVILLSNPFPNPIVV